ILTSCVKYLDHDDGRPLCYKVGPNRWAYIDIKLLIELAEELVENLNEVIDRTRYPIPEARYSNLRHRPIGMGMMGLADVFHLVKVAYDSVQAQEINHRIAEAIMYGGYNS